MDILSAHELRLQAAVLDQDGADALQLLLLLAVDIDLIIVLQMAADVLREQFEILVEARLRGDLEPDEIIAFVGQRRIQEYAFERRQGLKEFLLMIHVRGVQPDDAVLREDVRQRLSLDFSPAHDVGYDFRPVHLVLGQLGVAVEGMDLFDFIAPEGDAEREILGIGEDIDDGAADGILPGRGDEIHFLESLSGQGFDNLVMGDFLPLLNLKNSLPDGLRGRNFFGQRLGISYNDQWVVIRRLDRRISIRQYLSDGRSALHAQRRFIIAPFDTFSRLRQEENPIPFNEVIQVGRTVFSSLPVRQDHYLHPLPDGLG